MIWKRKNNPGNERILNLIIVDESGSMSAIYDEAFNGMNQTIKNIRKEADNIAGVKQYINLITFDSNHFKQHLRHCPAEKARTLSHDEYAPCGMTPLYDAVGYAVTALERHTANTDAVLVTIITDGEENCSTRYSAERLKRLIGRLSEKGWLFTFIGANQDVMYEAGKIGIRNAMAYEADSEGTNAMWAKERMSRKQFYDRVSKAKDSGKSLSAIMDKEKSSDYFTD